MKRAILMVLLAVLLAGCGAAESEGAVPETVVPETVPEATVAVLTETVPETTEPEIADETVWLPVYYTEQGTPELHILVKNGTMGNLSVEGMHTEYVLDGQTVKTADYDKRMLTSFLWRPFNKLDLSLAASTLLIVKDYPSADGFDHAVITVRTVDDQGAENILTYNFTMDETEVTPSTLTEEWELSTSWINDQGGWNWDHVPYNDTEDVLTLKYVHHIHYDDGIPVAAETMVPSQMGDVPDDVLELMPGTKAVDTSGVSETFRAYNQREAVYEYHDSEGNPWLQRFYFAYEDALNAAEYKGYSNAFAREGIAMPEGLTVLSAEEAVETLGGRQYSKEELQQMVDAQLTLDEAAEKISTLGDLCGYLNLRGYRYVPTPMTTFYANGQNWNAMHSAHTAFENNQGACSEGSTLTNYILQGDYDEQGYVQEVNAEDRHVFNWFRIGDTYYFVDWVEIIGDYDNTYWQIYAAEDPQIFADYDVKCSQEIATVYEIYLQYIYPREGTPYPIGIKRDKKPYIRTLPSEIEDDVMLLYEDPEICRLEYREGPPEENWPDVAKNP